MSYYPDNVNPNDPNAPWNQEEEKEKSTDDMTDSELLDWCMNTLDNASRVANFSPNQTKKWIKEVQEELERLKWSL